MFEYLGIREYWPEHKLPFVSAELRYTTRIPKGLTWAFLLLCIHPCEGWSLVAPHFTYGKVIFYFPEIESFCQPHKQCNHCPSVPVFLCQQDVREVISFSGQSRLSWHLSIFIMGVCVSEQYLLLLMHTWKSVCMALSLPMPIYFYWHVDLNFFGEPECLQKCQYPGNLLYIQYTRKLQRLSTSWIAVSLGVHSLECTETACPWAKTSLVPEKWQPC